MYTICQHIAPTERFKCLQIVYIIMARENTIRVNDEELELIKQYRDENYTGYVALGFVIGDLVKDD
jgi:hypothetical protein